MRPGYILLIPSQPSKLLEAIKSDATLGKNLTDQLKQVLNASEVELRLHQGNLIIYYSNTFNISDIVDSGVYANIASSLSSEKLQAFCNSTPQFSQICRDDNFWIQLIKEKFPRWYHPTKNRYEWKKVYLGLLFISETVDINSLFKYMGDLDTIKPLNVLFEKLSSTHIESLRYLLQEDFITFGTQQLSTALAFIKDLDIVKYLVNKYKHLIRFEILILAFEDSIGNPDLMKFYLEYRGVDKEGDEVKITRDDINNIDPVMIYNREPSIDLESYKLLIDFTTFQADQILNEMLELNSESEDFLNFYMEKLSAVPVAARDILVWYRGVEDYVRPKIVEKIWEKYKSIFTPEEIKEFVDLIHKYSEDIYLLTIIK